MLPCLYEESGARPVLGRALLGCRWSGRRWGCRHLALASSIGPVVVSQVGYLLAGTTQQFVRSPANRNSRDRRRQCQSGVDGAPSLYRANGQQWVDPHELTAARRMPSVDVRALPRRWTDDVNRPFTAAGKRQYAAHYYQANDDALHSLSRLSSRLRCLRRRFWDHDR